MQFSDREAAARCKCGFSKAAAAAVCLGVRYVVLVHAVKILDRTERGEIFPACWAQKWRLWRPAACLRIVPSWPGGLPACLPPRLPARPRGLDTRNGGGRVESRL